MYGLVDFYLAEVVTHIIGKNQAQQEVREQGHPKQMSIVARPVNRLPLWTSDQQFAVDVASDESMFDTASCE